MKRCKFKYKVGDIIYCQYYDKFIDEYKRGFAFVSERAQEYTEWGTDILYRVIVQNGPHNHWLFERDIIRIIDRKPYNLQDWR